MTVTTAIENPTFNTCHYSAKTGSTSGSDSGDMTMTGCIVPTTITKDDKDQRFITTDGTLKYNSKGSKLKGMRAYFTLTGKAKNSNAKAMATTFLLDNETTAIKGIRQDSAKNDNRWYDLSGRVLPSAPSVSGIYIHNGHKVSIIIR